MEEWMRTREVEGRGGGERDSLGMDRHSAEIVTFQVQQSHTYPLELVYSSGHIECGTQGW